MMQDDPADVSAWDFDYDNKKQNQPIRVIPDGLYKHLAGTERKIMN